MNIREQFELLQTNGEIGYYTHCELIQVFGISKVNATPFNIYTLIVFQDKLFEPIKQNLLTKKLIPINKEISCGILQSILSLDEVTNFFENLYKDNRFELDSKDCVIEKLKFLDKQFIRNSENFDKPQINYILKNNFYNGSYIIEAFALEKSSLKCFDDPVKLNEISEKLNEVLPIKISNVSDRLGNVIFQFPINVFKTKITRSKDRNKVLMYLDLHNKYRFGQYLQMTAINKFDNNIVSFNSHSLTSIQSEVIINSSEKIEIFIVNILNGLILYYNHVSFVGSLQFNMHLQSNQQRCFNLNGQLQRLSVYSEQNVNTADLKYKNERDVINHRKYEEQQNVLFRSRDFVQYYKNSFSTAINDIRTLIRDNGDDGVYLWDPYLDSIDIKNTLYFAPKIRVPLRAISGCKQESSKKNIFSQMKQNFEDDDKQFLFLNLEVRGRTNGYGYDFHDRFLIFPKEKPLVWSLGISVNQLGKSHHILQKVSNPQHVLNAFNQLWDELNHPECIIWKN